MGEKVNASELARRLGVSEGAVRKHVKRGMYRAGRDGLFDADDCRVAWLAGRDPDKVLVGMLGGQAVRKKPVEEPTLPQGEEPKVDAQPINSIPENSLTRARAANAVMQAQRQQLALHKEKGELIKTADAIKACRAVISVVLERLDGASAQIGARVVGLDAVAAERVAREILNAARAEIAGMAASVQEVASGG